MIHVYQKGGNPNNGFIDFLKCELLMVKSMFVSCGLVPYL